MLRNTDLPSLVSIGAFEAAARHGSFAKAARELGMTSAAVSYHVRQLERQVEVALFRRFPHRVELTAAGMVVAQEAAVAFRLLRDSFAQIADDDRRKLRVTALPTLGTSWLTPRLGRFRDLYPNVTVELELSPEPRDLVSGDFDIAIRHGAGNWPGLQALRLFPCMFTPLCAPSLKDRALQIAHPDCRLDIPLLGRPDWWDIWFKGVGGADVAQMGRFAISLAAEFLDIAAAIEGHGIAIGSPILFAKEIASGRLTTVHDYVADDGQAFWLVYPAARGNTAKIASFREWLLQEVASIQISQADPDVLRR